VRLGKNLEGWFLGHLIVLETMKAEVREMAKRKKGGRKAKK